MEIEKAKSSLREMVHALSGTNVGKEYAEILEAIESLQSSLADMQRERERLLDERVKADDEAQVMKNAYYNLTQVSDAAIALAKSSSDELAKLREQVPQEWIAVNGIEDVPLGDWLVYLEKTMLNRYIHSATVHENITFISAVCTWDSPRVIAYRPLPSPPQPEDRSQP